MIILSFILFLVFITGIGVSAARQSRKTTDDYILAGRSVGPIPTALSAVSTCHSGFMFIGMIGLTYKMGLATVWLVLAWLIGDLFAWLYINKPLRDKTESSNTHTLSSFISHRFTDDQKRILRLISAFFIILFLSVYAAAQLTAGSKALSVMLNWPTLTGILVGAVIVTAYSYSGGIRASIWTDVAQSLIMFVSMLGLFATALYHTGGFVGLFNQLSEISPHLVQIFPQDTPNGFPLYFFGWIAFGFGVIGQPHIMTRAMSIESSDQLKQARYYYFFWYIIFALASVGVGLTAHVLLPELASSDTELALPILATKLLPPLFVGGILAGLFSATISTADSQILTCSAAFTQDIFPKIKSNYRYSKLVTLSTMLGVVLIAVFGSKSVYSLVVLAWAGLSVVLGPLVLCSCFDIKVGYKTTIAMLIIPLISVITWVQLLNLSNQLNEVLVGFIVALVIFLIGRIGGSSQMKQP